MKQAVIDLTTRNGNRDDIINLSKAIHIRRYGRWVLVFYTPWRWFTIKFDTVTEAGDAITKWAIKMRTSNISEQD